MREIIPAEELKTALDNIGLPNSNINLALSDGSLMSSADGEVLLTLSPEHAPTADYVKAIRKALAERIPEITVFFQPPDISTQVLNFGLARRSTFNSPGRAKICRKNFKLAQQISRSRRGRIPGAVDVHLQQVVNAPEYAVEVDRTMASQFGITQRDVTSGVLVSLSSSGQAAPNFWLDPKSGIQYGSRCRRRSTKSTPARC